MRIIHSAASATKQHTKQNPQQIYLNWNLTEQVTTFSPDSDKKLSSFFKSKTCLSIETSKVSSPVKIVKTLNDIAKKNVLMSYTKKQLMTLPKFLQKELKVAI